MAKDVKDLKASLTRLVAVAKEKGTMRDEDIARVGKLEGRGRESFLQREEDILNSLEKAYPPAPASAPTPKPPKVS